MVSYLLLNIKSPGNKENLLEIEIKILFEILPFEMGRNANE